MTRSGQEIVAIVPARAGSKGLPGKNIRLLGGKPLYRHSVDTALAAGIGRVIVTTDIPSIWEDTLPEQVERVHRPPNLAADSTTMAEVMLDLLPACGLEKALIIILQPTSPFRTPETIRRGLAEYLGSDCKMLMSVSKADSSILKWGFVEDGQFRPVSDPGFCFANRQSLPEVFRPNGALYILSAQDFLAQKGFPDHALRALTIDDSEAIDIDRSSDFELCEKILAGEKCS